MKRTARLVGLVLLGFVAGCATVGCEPGAVPGPNDPNAELVCDQDYMGAVRGLIEGAEETLVAAQFELFPGTPDEIVQLLIAAAERGVAVRVLFDDEIEENADAVERLVAGGVDSRLDNLPETTMHAKMLAADNSVAILGSTNWSTSSIDRNHECNLLLRNGPPPAYAQAWFDEVWRNVQFRGVPDVDQSSSPHVRALANGELLERLLDKLSMAGRRVDFTLYATYLQPGNMGSPAMQLYQALADAADRGVTVRGVAEWSDWQLDNNERNNDAVVWLEERGVDMRWERADRITHAKAYLIDDALQIQSANISTSGFSLNHEVGAWTDLAQPVADFEQWFDALWDEGAE